MLAQIPRRFVLGLALASFMIHDGLKRAKLDGNIPRPIAGEYSEKLQFVTVG
jgi:hypothetical protein